jgi:hypothetical protein
MFSHRRVMRFVIPVLARVCDRGTGTAAPPPGSEVEVRVIRAKPSPQAPNNNRVRYRVTFTNVSNELVWVRGYGRLQPFYGVSVRASPGWCANGVREYVVAPGVPHSFDIDLDPKYLGQQFVVELPYATTPGKSNTIRALALAAQSPPVVVRGWHARF